MLCCVLNYLRASASEADGSHVNWRHLSPRQEEEEEEEEEESKVGK